MRLSNLLFLVFFAVGCKAQQPSFVGIGKINNEATATEYVEWYNQLVDKPKFDTVSAFIMPSVSTLRYVIIRTLNVGDVARVESKKGLFLHFLHNGNMVVSVVKWNARGEIVSGLDDIMVSGCPIVVQYEHCSECTFNQEYKGEL